MNDRNIIVTSDQADIICVGIDGPQGPPGTGGGGGGSGTVTSVSASGANGITVSVTNATTTPAISIAGVNLTPATIVATGTITGANLSGVNTGDQTLSGLGGVPETRTIAAGTGLTGGGSLAADRSLAVSFGSTAGSVCEGNDARLSDARTPTAHGHSWGAISSTPTTLAGYGITDDVILEGDPRLSDARPPVAHNQDASTITTGVLATARLGTGTPSAGKYLDGTGAWIDLPSGGGTPGGADGQVQVKSGTSFAGYAGFTFNSGTGTLTANAVAAGALQVDADANIDGTLTGTIAKCSVNLRTGHTSTTTAGGITTLTINSTQIQRFAGSSDQEIRHPSYFDGTAMGTGWTFRIINDGTGTLTIKNNSGSGTLTQVFAYGECELTLTDAAVGTWVARNIGSDVQTITSSGTWTKRPGTKYVDVICWPGGSGSGSGRRGAAGTVRCAGGGAGGGAPAMKRYIGSQLLDSESVTVGAAGVGGAAVTTDDTNGNNGTTGGNTEFSSGTKLCRANAGTFGSGGTATTGSGGVAGASVSGFGQNGGAASVTGGNGTTISPNTSVLINTCGGPSGGGITSANVGGTGGGHVGGAGPASAWGLAAGSGGGAVNGNGTNGPDARGLWTMGAAGSGGGAGTTGPGGTGGNGGFPSGPGGGGGASLNGNNSGKGGDGGPGCIYVITYF